jgi:pilus assembly protein Flp/PilA
MRNLLAVLEQTRQGEEGATMVEYGLMLALIAIVCVLAISALGGNLNLIFSNSTLLNALSP